MGEHAWFGVLSLTWITVPFVTSQNGKSNTQDFVCVGQDEGTERTRRKQEVRVQRSSGGNVVARELRHSVDL